MARPKAHHMLVDARTGGTGGHFIVLHRRVSAQKIRSMKISETVRGRLAPEIAIGSGFVEYVFLITPSSHLPKRVGGLQDL